MQNEKKVKVLSLVGKKCDAMRENNMEKRLESWFSATYTSYEWYTQHECVNKHVQFDISLRMGICLWEANVRVNDDGKKKPAEEEFAHRY